MPSKGQASVGNHPGEISYPPRATENLISIPRVSLMPPFNTFLQMPAALQAHTAVGPFEAHGSNRAILLGSTSQIPVVVGCS